MALQRSTVQTPLPKKPELLVNQKRMFWVESVILPGAFSWDLLCDAGWVQWWSRKERPQSELSQGTLQGCSGSCSSASVSLEAQAIPREHVWEANWVPPQTSPYTPVTAPPTIFSLSDIDWAGTPCGTVSFETGWQRWRGQKSCLDDDTVWGRWDVENACQ